MKKIEHLLKTNKAIQKIYIFTFSFLFRFLGLFIKIDKNLILFNSFSGKAFNDSPRVLFEAIKKDYKEYKCVWAFNNPALYEKTIGCKVVKQDSLKYFLTALKAGYWITNVNIERGLKIKRKGNICLNTWHGTGAKTIGNAVKGRNDYDFSNIEILLSDGEFLKQSYIKNFNAKEENIYIFGRPREDVLYDSLSNLDAIKSELLDQLNIPKNKTLILYAPTWRETTNGGKTYSSGNQFDLEKWSESLGDDYIILFRAHSIVNSYLVPQKNNIIDVTNVADINKLYLVSDILVSDYSSCYTDFSILSKPMLCYAPDYDEYVRERGLVFDLNPYFTHGVIKSEDELLGAIKNLDFKKEVEFSKKYYRSFVSANGNATKLSLDKLFSTKKDK